MCTMCIICVLFCCLWYTLYKITSTATPTGYNFSAVLRIIHYYIYVIIILQRCYFIVWFNNNMYVYSVCTLGNYSLYRGRGLWQNGSKGYRIICSWNVYRGIICLYVCMYVGIFVFYYTYRKSFNVKHLTFRVFTGSSGRQRAERRFKCAEFRHIRRG